MLPSNYQNSHVYMKRQEARSHVCAPADPAYKLSEFAAYRVEENDLIFCFTDPMYVGIFYHLQPMGWRELRPDE